MVRKGPSVSMMEQKQTDRKIVCVHNVYAERGHIPLKTFVFEKLPWKIGKV